MKITECRIVGAMTAPQGKAAFDRANVVVESRAAPGSYLQVRAYVRTDELEGYPLVREDWEALLRSDQAIEIAPVDAANGSVFWVLRRTFEGLEGALEELRTSGVLLHNALSLADGSFGCLVREPVANVFRDRWAEVASTEAMACAKRGQWERARVAAARAFVLERAMTAERIAMLSLSHLRCGNETGAEGYVEMARRSRGNDFAARVRERRSDLEREVKEDELRSVVVTRGSAARRPLRSLAAPGKRFPDVRENPS